MDAGACARGGGVGGESGSGNGGILCSDDGIGDSIGVDNDCGDVHDNGSEKHGSNGGCVGAGGAKGNDGGDGGDEWW